MEEYVPKPAVMQRNPKAEQLNQLLKEHENQNKMLERELNNLKAG
jgi:hypothetical protein